MTVDKIAIMPATVRQVRPKALDFRQFAVLSMHTSRPEGRDARSGLPAAPTASTANAGRTPSPIRRTLPSLRAWAPKPNSLQVGAEAGRCCEGEAEAARTEAAPGSKKDLSFEAKLRGSRGERRWSTGRGCGGTVRWTRI